MKILLACHAPWRTSGYGAPAMLTARMWEELGHQVAFMAIDTTGPGMMQYQGRQVVLMDRDTFGQDILADVCVNLEVDVIVSFFDPWVLMENGYKLDGGPKWIAWTPVDQEPFAERLGHILLNADEILSLSQWGMEALHRKGFNSAGYMPVAVDHELFRPMSSGSKNDLKEVLGITKDTMVFGLVGTNLRGDRKALAEQILGWCEFVRIVGKDRARLILHSDPVASLNIPRLVGENGGDGTVIYLSSYFRRYAMSSPRAMANFYGAMDVLLHATAAEGFGICMVEAMACGIPVIYSVNTSMPEICDGYGWKVDQCHRQLSPQGGWWYRPDIGGITTSLVYAYKQWNSGQMPSQDDLRANATRYSPELIGPKWGEVFARMV